MICLHCTYCCVMLDVVIVNPKIIPPKPGFKHQGDNLLFKKGGVPCPHLDHKEGKAFCKIHHYDWYEKTPCYSHTQTEWKNSNCRTGEYMLKNPELLINAR